MLTTLEEKCIQVMERLGQILLSKEEWSQDISNHGPCQGY